MAQIYKANSVALLLKSQLASRGYTAVLTYTSAGYPTLYIGTAVAGTANACYLIKDLPAVPAEQTTIYGTAQQYAPVQVLLATEANPAGGAGADILTGQQVTDFLGSAIVTGAKFSLWNSAAGVAPSTTTFDTASNQKSEFFTDIIWSAQSST